MREAKFLSGVELVLDPDICIVSWADLEGRLIYVNQTFIDISGFSEQELMGQPHSIVRHPEMPSAVFADMWADIKSGRPWVGLIRNRCKNGDSYWVEAHVSPVFDAGEITGYISMRRWVSPERVAAVAPAYAALKDGRLSAASLQHGQLVSGGWIEQAKGTLSRLPLTRKFMYSGLSAALLVFVLLGGQLVGYLEGLLDHKARERLAYDVHLVRASAEAIVDTAVISLEDRIRVYGHQAAAGAVLAKSADSPRIESGMEFFNRWAVQADGVQPLPGNGHMPAGFPDYLNGHQDFLQRLRAGETINSTYRDDGRYWMIRLEPISADGVLRGVNVAGLDLSSRLEVLRDNYRSLNIGDRGYYYILDAEPGPNFGALIMHPYKEGSQLVSLPGSYGDGLNQMREKSKGEITYVWMNAEAGERQPTEKVVAFESMTDPQWIVAGGSTVADFSSFSKELVGILITGGAVLLFVVLVVLHFLLRRLILDPINVRVLPAFKAISSGDFSTHLDITGEDSIARVMQGLESLQNRRAIETEQTEAYAALREEARRAAEALSRARADFLANMSHEIRTPMNAVIGLAYLLQRSSLGQRELDYVRRIESAGKLLLLIVNDVLDFSKIDAGQMQLEDRVFHLDDVLENVSSIVRSRAQEKRLILEYVLAPEVPRGLRGDPLRLAQILINLVGNAIKFTAQGAVIVFVSRQFSDAGELVLEFRVQDSGIGLTEAQSANLFKPFSQADSSISRKFGGTGLGLVICQRLVELMGGRIWVDSRPGVGATFAFSAKLHEEHLEETELVGRNYQVLLIDDHELSRSVIQDLLEKHGCRVQAVNSGDAAMRLLNSSVAHGFDCVFTDLYMPDMDGIEVAHQLRALWGSSLKLVMVTMADVHSERYRNAFGEFDAVIEKPVTSAKLGELLSQLRADSVLYEGAPRGVAHGEGQTTLAGLRILVAEDVPTNQLIIRDMLESMGATVEIVDNGALAVETLQRPEAAIDLVLMDVQMPEMDGLEATRRIRSTSHASHIPIIALTANALEDERQRTRLAGMDDFLTKPIEPQALIQVIIRWAPSVEHAVALDPLQDAEPDSMSFPEISGLDVVDGIARMMNRPELYTKVLRDFLARFSGEAERIRADWQAGQPQAAALKVHSLKGLAATVGAARLTAAARQLERLLKDEPGNVTAAFDELEHALSQVIEGIAAYFAAPDDE